MSFRSGYIGSSLGGVSIGRGKHDELIVASAKAWLMVYHLQFYPTNVLFVSGLWEKVSFFFNFVNGSRQPKKFKRIISKF